MAEINAEKRDGTGKGVARQLRRDGRLPAVLYGAGKENINLSLNAREWAALEAAQGAHLRTNPQTLILAGGARELVLLRGRQAHPVTSVTEHVDFLRFDPERRITIMIPVVIVGEDECPGIKRGGMVQTIFRELEIQCRAGSIPEQITVSVANLEIGSSIHVNDITLPPGVEVHSEDNLTLAAVVGMQAEKAEDVEGAEAGAAAEPAAAAGGEEAKS
ncbi:MAG: 50S ribosomal protein L25/general stress protein Ctc [Magnetococcales bacterium]|nr:50S ribosomal protein L25/general stress protein Ctc [Magnetococcales bacterium]